MCFPRRLLLLLLLALASGPALAQSTGSTAEAKTGYMVIDHQIYDQPLGNKSTLIKEGEHVRAEPVAEQRGWYVLFKLDGGSETQVGYVVEPFIWDEVPDEPLAAGGDGADVLPASTPPVLTSTATSEPAFSGEYEVGYVHQYTNVRDRASADGEIVAQLAPGTEIEIGEVAYNWASVRHKGEDIGHVWLPLIEKAAPGVEQTTTVYITRTGEKYHRESCRFLRSSKFARTLEEAIDEHYEACKVCHPPKPDDEQAANEQAEQEGFR